MNKQIQNILKIAHEQNPNAPVMKGVMAATLGLSDTCHLAESYNYIVEYGLARLVKCNRTRGWYLVLTRKGEEFISEAA